MTVREEVDEMLKSLTNTISEPEPEPKTEEVKDGTTTTAGSETDKPTRVSEEVEGDISDSVKEVSSDRGDSRETNEKAPDVEQKSETKSELEPKVPDEKDKIIEDLRAKLAAKEVPAAPKEEPKVLAPPSEQDFIGDLDLDELTRDPKEFNKVLNKIYQKAVIDTRSGVMETLPDIVKTNIAIMNELKETSQKFYEDNEDLKPFKKVVGAVFEEIAASNPTKNYAELIKEVGPEVRKRLDLAKQVPKTKVEKAVPPNLPQKGGKAGRVSDKPEINPLQAELEEMNKVIGR